MKNIIIFIAACKFMGQPANSHALLFPILNIGHLNAEISFIVDKQS